MDVKAWAYPAGSLPIAGEGLLDPSGPIALGAGELGETPEWSESWRDEAEEAAEAMSATAAALQPQIDRENEAKREAQARAETKAQDAPYRAYLRELAEIMSASMLSPEEESQGRTEVEFMLYKVDRIDGKDRMTLCHKERRNPEEAMDEGMPDLEGLALVYAQEKGVFGKYAWRVRAWNRGECIKQNHFSLNLAEPPGYVAPEKPAERKDPMDEVKNALTLVRTFREALGSGGNEGQSAGLLAKIEAMEVHRREIRDLEDRHERKLKEAIQDAYERGKTDGEKDASLRLERQIWELERDLERAENANPNAKTDVIDKIVGLVGGPSAVAGLIGAVANAAAAPKAPNARETRTPPPYQGPRPALRPVATVQPLQPSLALPSYPQVTEALEALGQAMEVLRASPESNEQIDALLKGFDQQIQEGIQAQGPALAQWWANINHPLFPTEDGSKKTWLDLARQLEATEEDKPMNIEDLKILLVQRLEEGKAPSEILEELNETVPAELREEWKGYLKWVPAFGALGFLGIPEEHAERGTELLELFKAS